MLGWIIAAAVVLLLVLLGLTGVGIGLQYGPAGLRAELRIGLIHKQLYPSGKPEAEAKETPSSSAKKPKEKKPLPTPTVQEIKEAVGQLWPPLKKALQRMCRGVRIDPLRCSVTVGGEDDPAAAAELYGYLHAGVWSALPVLEQLLVIPDPYVHIGIDFDAKETVAEGTLALTARIATLLHIALTVAVPALRWFRQYQKKHQETAAGAAAAQ